MLYCMFDMVKTGTKKLFYCTMLVYLVIILVSWVFTVIYTYCIKEEALHSMR